MFYGWPLLAVLCLIYLLGIGPQYYGFGVVLPRMIEDMGWARTEASLGYSLLALALGLVSPLVAMSIRRLGIRWTVLVGGVLAAAGALAVAFATSLVQYYVGAVLLGAGVGMQTVIPGTTLVTNWFLRRRALAMGLFLTAGGLGGFIAAPAFQSLMAATGTWRTPWYAMAGASLVAGVLGLIFAREKPEDVGQFPDGVDPAMVAATEGINPEASRVYRSRVDWSTAAALRTPTLWLIVLGNVAFVIGLNIVVSQSVAYLEGVGIAAAIAAAALGTVAIVSTVGRLVTGSLGDRIEPRYLLAIGLLGQLVGMIVLLFTRTPLMAYVYVALFGLGYGIAYVCVPALIGNYFGRANYPNIFGIVTPIGTVFGALGPLLAGLVYDMTGAYTIAFVGFAVLAAIAMTAAIIARPPQPAGVPALGEVGDLGFAGEE